MKNVLLATSALVLTAGMATAASHGGISWSAGSTVGYNDDIEGGLFHDTNLDIEGTWDLGDGYTATVTYGFDLDNSTGSPAGLQMDAFPTVEITSPYGSLKGGDLGDKGASEYFYKDRDGMIADVENHDSSTQFDWRALVEFGDYGLTVGGDDDGANNIDGLSVGAGATVGNFTVGLGFDQGDSNQTGNTVAVSVDTTFGAAKVGLSYISRQGVQTSVKTEITATDNGVGSDLVHVDTAAFTIADYNDTSLGLSLGYDISSDISVGAYYANNNLGGNAYGVSASYTSGALSADVYYDLKATYGLTGGTDVDGDGYYDDGVAAPTLGSGSSTSYGVNVSYAVSGELKAYAGYKDAAGTAQYYVGAKYTINDNLSATVSYSDGDEVSGPEFKDGISAFLTASF